MTREINLRPDCTNCAALCCVVFSFDKSESFAFDKAAGEVCSNLTDCGTCGIFEGRARLGFPGCVAYDCHGAGQRVTQEVFSGRSWRDNPALSVRMGEALSVLRRIHEQLALLESAEKLPLSPQQRDDLESVRNLLCPEELWTEGRLAGFPLEAALKSVSTFLRGLRGHIQPVS